MGGLSANGTPAFRAMFEPLMPGFIRTETPYVYRNPFTRIRPSWPRSAPRCSTAPSRTRAPAPSPPSSPSRSGRGGLIVPPAEFWPLVRKVCDRHGILLIADEVVTGFGRTGSLFGSRLWGVAPDIMVFAKGINSGYVPLGATMFNARIEQAFRNNPDAWFMHGNTYLAHPLACAAALANLDIVVKEDLAGNAASVGGYFPRAAARPAGAPAPCRRRARQGPDDRRRAGGRPQEQGTLRLRRWLRQGRRQPLPRQWRAGAQHHDTFIISPPLVLTRQQVDRMVEVMDEALTEETKKRRK